MSADEHGVAPVAAAALVVCVLWAGTALGAGGIVPIPEFKRWESNMVKYGQKHFDESSKGLWEGNVWYYDGQRVFYQIADYTKDKKWVEAAHNSRKVYRGYVLKNDGRLPGWRIFPHGLKMDWDRHEDGDSKKAAILLSQRSAFARKGGGPGEGLSRETAYCINAYIAAKQLGEPLSPNIEKSVNWALGHIDQWFVKNASDNWAPFMFGLTCEALINYYDNVKKDPRILPKIKMGLDECWKRAWVEKDQAFWYRARNKSKGAADLNLIVAPAYAWVYLQTGDVKYRDWGDRLFAGGVKGAWLDGGKMFSQNYRWSFNFVDWRMQAEMKRIGAVKEPGEAVAKKARDGKAAKAAAGPGPMAALGQALEPVVEKARAGDFAGALAECGGIAAEGAGAEALDQVRAGLEAGAELRKHVIAGASRKKPRVYIDFAGRPTRAKLLSADGEGGSFEVRGAAMPIKWKQISPARFYGIAAKFAPETPAGHLMLGRYCAVMGLAEAAAEELARASREAALRVEVEKAKILLK